MKVKIFVMLIMFIVLMVSVFGAYIGTNLNMNSKDIYNVNNVNASIGNFDILNIQNSTNITITESQITDLTHYTDSDIDGTESAFTGWDKNSSDDFDGVFASLTSIPAGLSDGDDDTTYTNSSFDLGSIPGQITEADISDLSHTVDTNSNTICSGTTTYLDGEGNCDDISSVYEPSGNYVPYTTNATCDFIITGTTTVLCIE